MKKLTALFVLLLTMSFSEISAETIRWSTNYGTSLLIKVNGCVLVNSSGINSGVLTVNVSDYIEVYGTSLDVLYPIITEDDEWMLAQYSIVEGDDYWYANGNTSIYESFTIYDTIDMYVEMKTW